MKNKDKLTTREGVIQNILSSCNEQCRVQFEKDNFFVCEQACKDYAYRQVASFLDGFQAAASLAAKSKANCDEANPSAISSAPKKIRPALSPSTGLGINNTINAIKGQKATQ